MKKNRIKEISVCMLTDKFPPYYSGGAKQALSLSKKLIEKGVYIFVVTSYPNSTRNNLDIIEGIKVYRLGRMGCFLNKYSFLLRIIKTLFLKRNSFKILHIHGLYTYSLAGLMISKLIGKKVIIKMVNFGGDDPTTIKKRMFGNFQLKLFSLADRFISISSELSESFRQSKLEENKLVEIPNGVDTDEFSIVSLDEKKLLRRKLGLPEEEIIACFVGVINKRKGVDLLIDAWERVTYVLKNIKLVLVGPKDRNDGVVIDESFIKKLYQKIEENNLSKKIIFTGAVSNVVEYLQASDMFILATRGEGLPNSLLEAMACGLPCIATRIRCIQDIITDNKDGLMFNMNDIENLTELILKLSQDENIRKDIGFMARMTIEKRFSLNLISDKYIKLYNQLLNQCSD